MSDVLDDLRQYGEAVERASIQRASDRQPVAAFDDPGSEEPHETRRHLAIVASVIAVAILGAFALSWLFHRGDQADRVVIVDQPTSSTTVSPAPTDAGPTPEKLKAADELLSQQQADGWVPYGGKSAISGATAPSGWIRYRPLEDMAPTVDHSGSVAGAHLERLAVYDEPDGTIIGYHFQQLGFVPADQADTFDATAARVELFGCDAEGSDCIPIPEHAVPTTGSGAG